MIQHCAFLHLILRIVLGIRTVMLAFCLIRMTGCALTLATLGALRPLLRRLPRRPVKSPLQVFPSRPRRLSIGSHSVAKALRGALAHRPRLRLPGLRLLLRLRGLPGAPVDLAAT